VQTLRRVELRTGLPPRQEPVPFVELDEATASAILADLTEVT
jgi:hypothetical protein